MLDRFLPSPKSPYESSPKAEAPEINVQDRREPVDPEKGPKLLANKVEDAGNSLSLKEELEASVKLNEGKERGMGVMFYWRAAAFTYFGACFFLCISG